MRLNSFPRSGTTFLPTPLSLRYGIYYAVSDNRSRFRDLEAARRDLGFVPQNDINRWSPEA